MSKVKIGIHQHVFTSKFNSENLDILDYIRNVGFDSMDINLRSTDIKFASKLRKRAEKLGLFLTGGGSLTGDKEIVSQDKQKRKEAIEYMKDLIKKTAEIGASLYHGLVYATPGLIVGRGPTEEELEYSAEALKEVASFAKKYGISIGLETANRYENYLINTVEGLLRLLDVIDEPNVGLLLDLYHMNIEEKDMYKSIVSAKDKIFHFHVNENDRGIPGTGHIPWDDIFRALKEVNYNKIVTIESFVGNSIDISSVVAVWRKLAPSPEAMAEEGYKFIKKMSEKYL